MSRPNAPSSLTSRLSTLSLNPTAQPFQSMISTTSTTESTAAAPPKTNKHGKPLMKNQLKQHQKYRGRVPGATNQSVLSQPLASVPSNSASMTNQLNGPPAAQQKQTKHQEKPPTNTYQPCSESNQSKSGQLITNRHGEPLGKKAREARDKQIAEVQARRDQEAKAEAARQEAIARDQARRAAERAKFEAGAEGQRTKLRAEVPTGIEAIRDFIISTQRDITQRYAAMGHPAWMTAKTDGERLVEMWKKR